MVKHRKDDLIAFKEIEEREATVASVVTLIFCTMAEKGEISDTDIITHGTLLDFWKTGSTYEEGNIRRCPADRAVYRCFRTPNPLAKSSLAYPSVASQNWKKLQD